MVLAEVEEETVAMATIVAAVNVVKLKKRIGLPLSN